MLEVVVAGVASHDQGIDAEPTTTTKDEIQCRCEESQGKQLNSARGATVACRGSRIE